MYTNPLTINTHPPLNDSMEDLYIHVTELSKKKIIKKKGL